MDQARLACGELQPLARSGAPAAGGRLPHRPMTEPQLRDRLAKRGGGLSVPRPVTLACQTAARIGWMDRQKPGRSIFVLINRWRETIYGTHCTKFGGSSVANADRVRNVARIITETYRKGQQRGGGALRPGDTTDDLIAKAAEINPRVQAGDGYAAGHRGADLHFPCAPWPSRPWAIRWSPLPAGRPV